MHMIITYIVSVLLSKIALHSIKKHSSIFNTEDVNRIKNVAYIPILNVLSIAVMLFLVGISKAMEYEERYGKKDS